MNQNQSDKVPVNFGVQYSIRIELLQKDVPIVYAMKERYLLMC